MTNVEGRLQTILLVEMYRLKINDDLTVCSLYQFYIEVKWEYYPAKYSKDWEELSEPEWVDLHSVKVIDRAYVGDYKGITVILEPAAELLDIIDQEQYLKLCDALVLKQERVKL